ncbi:hypothetical protein D1007_61620 [Hordeum vulgare]|nr:hypothetical protein D1007_61620 [Hordeum vulgare]
MGGRSGHSATVYLYVRTSSHLAGTVRTGTMAAIAWHRDLWNHWAIQILVIFSLGLQIFLFFFAWIRRRGGHPVLRFLLWLAYQLADYTATYALGHLSLTGAAREHPIVVFWAPFFLLHLGGPDNITAYSLEDNELWKRHLLNAILQVSGVVYVLYEYIADTGALLRLASILMLAMGAVKYGEKTCALMRGNLNRIRASLKKQPRSMHGHFHPQDQVLKDGQLDEESLVRRAHSLFHICKHAIVDYQLMEDDSHSDTRKLIENVKLWRLMEIELSLMYDMLYTKASVIHTWFGYLVRIISPLAIAASLLLFMFVDKEAHRRVDINITYILYGGALFMEMMSLLNALGSSWTFVFLSTTRCHWLRYAALCNQRWDRLRRAVAYLHHLVRVGGGSRYSSRRWSHSMAQYNMLHLCTGSDSALTRPLLGSLAKVVGLGLTELWNKEYYSWDIDMTDHLKVCISEQFKKLYGDGGVNTLGMIKNRWGEEPLACRGFFGGIFKDSLGDDFQECIIIWHIGSAIFLAKSQRAKEEDALLDVEAIRAVSNHMMFLLVKQPDTLPGRSQNRICSAYMMTPILTPEPLTEKSLQKSYMTHEGKSFAYDASRLPHAAELAKELLRMEKDDGPFDLVLDVWMDILVYAAINCSKKFYAEKLNNGGELTAVLWLLIEHVYQLRRS